MSSNLLKAALAAAVVLPAGNAIAQGLAPMVGASAIQGTLQGTSMPAYTGAFYKARNTVNTVNTATTQQAAAGSGSSPGPSSAPLSSTQKMASGASSGASVNGQAIPLCSHGGLCQGAVMRAIGRP
jgi:phage-related minor tail protein